MYHLQSIDKSCVFRQTFGSIPETLTKPLTVTGTLVVQSGEYRTLSQNQKLTFKDTTIGNFGTAPFSIRIISKIAGWLNVGSTNNILVSKGTAGAAAFSININAMSGGNHVVCWMGTTSGTLISSTAPTFDPNKFYDIVVTRSGTTGTIYINGLQVGSVTSAGLGASVTSTNGLVISGSTSTLHYIKQSAKLVELYNKALAADEVLALYNNNKFSIYNPIMDLNKWLKISGTWSEAYQTTDDPIVPKGQKIFVCNTLGGISTPSKQAYGTWEFSFKKVSDNSTIHIPFINSSYQNLSTATTGFSYRLTSTEAVFFIRRTSTTMNTVDNYIALNTWYRGMVIRTLAGVFYIYIKGGAFGNNYVLVSPAGGTGTNPTTDTSYPTSNYFSIYTQTGNGDQFSDIRFYPWVV